MINRTALIGGLFFLALTGLWAVEETRQHIKIVETIEASAPHIFDDTIFFSYKPKESVRYVGIAFAHENFREIHIFQRNEKGVLFYFYPLPEGIRGVDYRFVIDGLWTTDPANPQRMRSNSGLFLSRYEFPESAAVVRPKSPFPRDDGTVEFNLEAPPGKAIYLSGSFNGWDPYMYRLAEVRPGLYSLNLRLLPGTYYYIFRGDGKKYLDPLNPNRGHDPEGYEISVLNITP
jgi:1,4-alpha-glucan branching enzyme